MNNLFSRLRRVVLGLIGIRYNGEEDALAHINRVDAAYLRQPCIGSVFLSLGTTGLVILFLVWAYYAELDEVTHGQGQVVASQRTQVIQNLEGGILQAVLVKEGEVVAKDQPLAQLDNTGAESLYRDAQNKALENEVALVRLEAEKDDTTPNFSPELRAKAPQIVADQEEIFISRRNKYVSELGLLKSQYQQRMSDVTEQQARKKQMQQTLDLAQQRMDISRPLMEKRLFPKVEYLDLEQKVVTLQGDISALESGITKAQEAAQEADQKLQLRKNELDAQVSEEINKRRTELNSLLETMSAGGDRVTRTEIRSPVRGTVKQISINTLGGVVRPGEAIMEVVPLDDTLLVEVRIRPADIAFVQPTQRSMVKITAYDFSIYGGLEAHVEQISADTMEDKRGEFYYLVKLRTTKSAISYRNSSLPIIPGMVASVDIVSGKKSILDYLLKPIMKARQNALRER